MQLQSATSTEEILSTLPARLLMAGILFFILAAGALAIFFGGLLIGVMATDACTGMPDYVSWWLLGVWPGVMILTVLVPPALILFKRRWYWVVGSLASGITASAGIYILWFPILGNFCS